MTDAPLVAVLDYGSGNVHSAVKALSEAGADARLTKDRGLIADDALLYALTRTPPAAAQTIAADDAVSAPTPAAGEPHEPSTQEDRRDVLPA